MRRYVHARHLRETIDENNDPSSNTGTLVGIAGWLANRIKAITGKGSWRDTPDATLADAATHHDRADNPHGVTASQAGARPATWVPGWNEVTGKPVSFPSSWSEVAGKPSVFAPTNHNDRHRAGGLDPLTASDVGAAPASHVGSRDGHPLASATQNGLYPATDKTKLDRLDAGGVAVGAFAATPSANQSISGTSKVLCNVEEWDVSGNYDPTNARYTANQAGLYSFVGVVLFSNATADTRFLVEVFKNGARHKRLTESHTSVAGNVSVSGSAIISAVSGDYFELYAFVPTTQTILAGAAYTYFQGSYIGAQTL